MNSKPLVQVDSGSAIPAKAALKMLKRFSQAAQNSVAEQGLDLTNRERESQVSQDVLEHLVMIENALREELDWLADRGSGAGGKILKGKSSSGSAVKAAGEASVADGSASKPVSSGKKRSFSDAVVAQGEGEGEGEGGEQTPARDKKDKKDKKESGKKRRKSESGAE